MELINILLLYWDGKRKFCRTFCHLGWKSFIQDKAKAALGLKKIKAASSERELAGAGKMVCKRR